MGLQRIPCDDRLRAYTAPTAPDEYYGEHHAQWRIWNTKSYVAPNDGAFKSIACQVMPIEISGVLIHSLIWQNILG